MKRLLMVLVTASGAGLLGACGSGEVVVMAEGPGREGETIALPDLVVQLLPYDRDAIFDSLAAAYPEPEPQIPDTLIKLQEAMAAAQEEWHNAEQEWIALRDSLKSLSDRMQGLSRAQAEYVVMFRDFEALEPRVQRAERVSKEAFDRFEQLQRDIVAQSQAIKIQIEEWEDRAFAPIDSIIPALLKELGRDIVVDTTDATGRAPFRVKPGKWWVHARYDLPFHELYWNIPVEVKRGEPLEVRLTPDNAERRRKL